MLENFRLRVFRLVAQHLSFRRAAEELLLTQPAVTQQVKALEEELGVALFDRAGGKIRLTAAGTALAPFAERMRTLSDEAVSAVAMASGDHAGELRLAASQTIAQYVLPQWIARYCTRYPKVHVTLHSGNTDEVLDALVKGDVQMSFIEGPEQRKDLRIEPFLEDHMVLVVPAHHAWANREIALDDLKSAPLLMREFGSGSRRVVEQALRDVGVNLRDCHVVMELDSTEGLLQAVEAGLGVTFVSRWAVRNQLALQTLRVARVKGLRLARQFAMVFPAGPDAAGNAGDFRDLVLMAANEVPSQPRKRV